MEISSILEKLPGGHALNTAKDRLLAKGAKAQINRLIGRYGTMLEFRLNTADRSLFVSLLLKGEQSPIEINIHEYELLNSEGKTYVEIDGSKVDTSREWLTKLIRDQFGRKKLMLPEKFAWLIRLL
jgi:hypothetical protein